jgi:hypothetical protein
MQGNASFPPQIKAYIQANDPEAHMDGYKQGSVATNRGTEIVFRIFNAGEIFGEIAVLDGDERSASQQELDHDPRRRSHKGLVVTDVPKVPIWKAVDFNVLRRGMCGNSLISGKSQLFQLNTRSSATEGAWRSRFDL